MMQDIAMHIIDIVQNSIAAQANHISVMIYQQNDTIGFWVKDDGIGMSQDKIKEVIDPFVTSRTTRKIGLGLALLHMSTQQCGGSLVITSKPHAQTSVHASWNKTNIDTPPWGELDQCWMICYQSFPHKSFIMEFNNNDKIVTLDNHQIWSMVQEQEFYYDPAILVYIKQFVQEQLQSIEWSNT